ncbi:MAG: PSD1 and planctomycete cytochrome C domain-containing protein [Bryobacteraceae bacterium]
MRQAVLFAFVVSAAAADPARDVQALFKAKCTGCHGAAMQQAGLRLDQRASAMKAIVPGSASTSRLIARVEGRGVPVMPPAGKRLEPAEIALLTKWIDDGAKWVDLANDKLWSFQPIRRPAGSSIDEFIRARLAKENIEPSPEAPRATLLRRLSLDLTGLPPTPEELSAYLADTRPDAYSRQVERLLQSPHYGEKWARQWLDLARYADSDGYEKDWVRPHAWRWRHWVIEALNNDMPFDRFTREQIAGDLIPGAGVEQRVALGFHRNTLTNREGGIDNEQFRFENVVDRSTTVATVWLGLTLGCAQCHDHKYDPLTTKDYYSLAAFFDNLEEIEIDAPLPGEMGPWLRMRTEYRTKREALLKDYHVAGYQSDWERNMLQASAEPGKRTDWDLAWDCLLKLTETGDGEKIMRKAPAERTARERDILVTHFVTNYHFAVGRKRYNELKFDELDKKLRALDREYPLLSQAQTVIESDHQRKSYVRIRGNYKNLGDEVVPAVPASLPAVGAAKPTRLDLAEWLTSRQNPLTARVTANRIWQEYFGRGIVETAEDFGFQGTRPTHPELLDYLASEFMDNGWSLKHLHRLIVNSATYKQSSKIRPDLETKDPNNLLLARQSRVRLSAELVRDSALAVSGLLYPAVGGKSVRPPQPKGVTELGYAGGTKWEENQGPERYRRGLYIHFQRTTPYPLLMNFDAPKSTVPACRRGRSNTALQALNLLNDPVFLEAAQALAERLQQESDFSRAVTSGYLLALGREPSAPEVNRLQGYFDRQKDWTGLASILLNLDEFIVRE